MQPHFVAAQPDEYGDYRAVVPMPDATWTCFRLRAKLFQRERTEWYNNNDLVKLFQNHNGERNRKAGSHGPKAEETQNSDYQRKPVRQSVRHKSEVEADDPVPPANATRQVFHSA